MTREQEILLKDLKDLYGRVFYEVKCKDVTLDFTGILVDISTKDNRRI